MEKASGSDVYNVVKGNCEALRKGITLVLEPVPKDTGTV